MALETLRSTSKSCTLETTRHVISSWSQGPDITTTSTSLRRTNSRHNKVSTSSRQFRKSSTRDPDFLSALTAQEDKIIVNKEEVQGTSLAGQGWWNGSRRRKWSCRVLHSSEMVTFDLLYCQCNTVLCSDLTVPLDSLVASSWCPLSSLRAMRSLAMAYSSRDR